MAPTHYEILGVAPTATDSDIRHAYLSRARKYHPDFYANETEDVRAQAERYMQMINVAASVLGDSQERRRYDEHLRLEAQAAARAEAPASRRARRGAPTTNASPAAATTAASGGSAKPRSARRSLKLLPLLIVAAVALLALGAASDVFLVLMAGLGCAVVAVILGLVDTHASA